MHSVARVARLPAASDKRTPIGGRIGTPLLEHAVTVVRAVLKMIARRYQCCCDTKGHRRHCGLNLPSQSFPSA